VLFRLLEKYQAEILSLLSTGKTQPQYQLAAVQFKLSPLSIFPFEEKKN
jgi:hypothetical protein